MRLTVCKKSTTTKMYATSMYIWNPSTKIWTSISAISAAGTKSTHRGRP